MDAAFSFLEAKFIGLLFANFSFVNCALEMLDSFGAVAVELAFGV